MKFRSVHKNLKYPHVWDVECEEVHQLKEELEIIDVRTSDEFYGELGHIPGARLIHLEALPLHLNEIPKERAVVFVCRSGNRSAQAASFAYQRGYVNVFNLKGGMLKWNELYRK